METGLVASLERPGGNVTGIAFLIRDLEARRVDALRALAPKTRRVAALMNTGNPAIAHAWKMLEEAARGFIEALLVDVRKRSQIEEAFDVARSREADALIVQLGSLGAAQRQSVVELPRAIACPRSTRRATTSMPAGWSRTAWMRRSSSTVPRFVDRLARGAKPAESAMEPPPRFELVINRKTLRALDLVIPPDLLLRSNEIV